MTESVSIVVFFSVMVCITASLVGFLILIYWLLIGSRLPPNIRKLKEKRDIAGLRKALDYLNPDRDFWNVRRAAVQALGEISLMSGNGMNTEQAAEGLFYALQSGGKPIDATKVLEGKIPFEKFTAFYQRIEQIRLLAAQTLGHVGTRTQNTALRLQILDAFIKVVEQGNNPNRDSLDEELNRTALPILETITGQKLGPDHEKWLTWRREYHP